MGKVTRGIFSAISGLVTISEWFVREGLAIARCAGFERLDHNRIGDDHLERFFGPGGREHGPILVSPEVGEGDSARRCQRVLVLSVNGRGAQDRQHCRGYRNRALAFARHADPFLR